MIPNKIHFYYQNTIAFLSSEYDCISIITLRLRFYRHDTHFHYQNTIAFLSSEYDCISIVTLRLRLYRHDTHFYYQNTISDSLYSLFLLREFVCNTQKTSPVTFLFAGCGSRFFVYTFLLREFVCHSYTRVLSPLYSQDNIPHIWVGFG